MLEVINWKIDKSSGATCHKRIEKSFKEKQFSVEISIVIVSSISVVFLSLKCDFDSNQPVVEKNINENCDTAF